MLNLSKSGAEVKLWNIFYFCGEQNSEGKCKTNDKKHCNQEKEKKTEECRESWNLVTNSLQISGLSPTPYLKMNHLEIDTCFTSVCIWHHRSYLIYFNWMILWLIFTSSGCCAPFPQGRGETAARICGFWEYFFVFGLRLWTISKYPICWWQPS